MSVHSTKKLFFCGHNYNVFSLHFVPGLELWAGVVQLPFVGVRTVRAFPTCLYV